jgi:hypothetical protein
MKDYLGKEYDTPKIGETYTDETGTWTFFGCYWVRVA